MSWTDKVATEQILKLRDEFNIKTYVETGTFRGVNAELFAHYFNKVLTVDINEENLKLAKKRLRKYQNVKTFKMTSWNFLALFNQLYRGEKRDDFVFLFLDAHFYDPELPLENKWVVIKELKALEGFSNAIICIHDFDCGGLGHLRYDNESLGWGVIKDYITKVNPNFSYYTNTKDWADPIDTESIKTLPISFDDAVKDSIRFVNSSDEKKYRGCFYALPRKIDTNRFKLKEFICN